MEKIPMGLQMVEELIAESISEGCDYFQILDKIRVRKPLGEDVSDEDRDLVDKMIEESKIQRAVLSSEALGDYFTELSGLDWFYEYSDDHSVWKRGQEAYENIQRKKYQNETTLKMFNDFRSWSNGRRERPERKDYEI